MTGAYMIIYQSANLRRFKDLTGKPNHNLMTSLVSLDFSILKSDDIQDDISDIYKHWNPPKNRQKSFNEAKLLVTNATLAWIVDAIDYYYSSLIKNPRLVVDQQLANDLNQQSVYSKHIKIFERFSKEIPEVEYSLATMGINWRNNLMHYFATHAVDQNIKRIISQNKEIYSRNFIISIDRFIEHLESSVSPSIPELLAIIRSSIYYIESLDKILLENTDIDTYITNIIVFDMKNKLKNKKSYLKEFIHDSVERKIKKLENIIQRFGGSNSDHKSGFNINSKLIETFAKSSVEDWLLLLKANGE